MNKNYFIQAINKKTNKILIESELMDLSTAEKNYFEICIELYFEGEFDDAFDEIEFKIVKMKKINNDMVKYFSEVSFVFKNEEEKTITDDEDLMIFHYVFSEIDTLIKNQILVDEFLKPERILFINNKIQIIFNELTFINEEERKKIAKNYFSSMMLLYVEAEKNDYFEVQSNINSLIKLNSDFDTAFKWVQFFF